jgi:hypothetical protein
MAKPLLRWTMGGVSKQGQRLLRWSVRSVQKVYGDEFDYLICYNNLDPASLADTGLPLRPQEADALPLPPKGVAWKLYPPRVAPDRHEVWLDNDIIIYRRIPGLDDFLRQDNAAVMTEGLERRCGRWDGLHPPGGPNLNSGLFGIPPGFDFRAAMMELLNSQGFTSWEDYFDEQGLVALVLKQHFGDRLRVVGNQDISICFYNFYMGRCGCHLSNVNISKLEYWHEFLARTIL